MECVLAPSCTGLDEFPTKVTPVPFPPTRSAMLVSSPAGSTTPPVDPPDNLTPCELSSTFDTTSPVKCVYLLLVLRNCMVVLQRCRQASPLVNQRVPRAPA